MSTGEELVDLGGEPGEIFVVPREEEEELGTVERRGGGTRHRGGTRGIHQPRCLCAHGAVRGGGTDSGRARSWVIEEALGSLGEQGALGASSGRVACSYRWEGAISSSGRRVGGRLGEQPTRIRGMHGDRSNDGRTVHVIGEADHRQVAHMIGEANHGQAAHVISELDKRAIAVCAREKVPGEAVLATGVGGRTEGGLGKASL
ncbi:unnamed protein product [Ilex paraguariensis]|uniref:Uncharacterized protein n=1 Tax=Ilex paraguariensis TaxID=185542 RepID=A0ABC8U516_9AQUA